MIRNYFKIALRNLAKNLGFTVINVLGLALGMGCFIVIAIYVVDELSYDRYNENADRIFRVNTDMRFGGTDLNMAVSSDPLGETLKNDYPEVEQYVRLFNSSGSKMIKKGDEFIEENAVVHADSTLFDIFSLPAIIGKPKTSLNDPNTVVISESAAKRYFGSPQLALGEFLETNDGGNTIYKVTAVIEDIPKTSHFHYDFIFSMDNVQYGFGNYLSNNFHTYILLRPGVDYKEFNKNFDEVVEKYIIPQAAHLMQIESKEAFEKSGNRLDYTLFPLTDIHLKSNQDVEIEANGNIQYVYIFSAVALFILLIACINFMNLTTARSSGRAKEVGVRKVLGTTKKSLIGQFLTESTLIAILSLKLALFFAWASLDWFSGIAGKDLSLDLILQPKLLVFLIVLPFAVGILAGLYPAFYLSAFKPIAVLKGKLNIGAKRDNFRSTLVVFQFVTSIILIVGTMVIYKQLNFMRSTNVGFNKERVLIVENTGVSTEARMALKSEIAQISDVESSSFAGYIPVSNSSRSDTTFSTESIMTESNGFNMQNWSIDYDYLSTMGMELIEGRNFSPSFGSDSTAILLNETAAKLTGFKEPVGEKIYSIGINGQQLAYNIVGVVKNFNFSSLRNNVGALSMRLDNNSWASAYRFKTEDIEGLLSTIESKYKKFAPAMPFIYHFLDESFDQMYRQEQRVGKVALTFSILAVIIACLGLFGLSIYLAELRTKEIGIRKVLGASVKNIVTMLSKDFVKLILIAFVIAIPVAWWSMNRWLQDFAFRIEVDIWVFVITGLASLTIALVTLSFQAIKAAIANPTESLRTE